MKAKLTTTIAITILAFLTQGCNSLKKNQPSSDQIKVAIAAEAPPFLTVVDVTPEFLPGPTDKQWLINVKVTLAPKEDLFNLPSRTDVIEINELINQNHDLLSWNSNFMAAHQQDGLPAVKMEAVETPQLLVVKQRKNESISVYGKINAEQQVDRWNMSTQLEFPDQGKPISSFGGAATTHLFKGSPTADEWLKKLRKTVESNEAKKLEMTAAFERQVEENAAKIERQSKENAAKLEAMKKAQRDALLASASPGSRYVGTFATRGSFSAHVTEKVSIEFEKSEMNGSLLEFKVASVNNPNQWLRYRGRIDINQQEAFFITAKDIESRVADNSNNTQHGSASWWFDKGWNRKQCKSIQIENNHFVMELNDATINAERAETP